MLTAHISSRPQMRLGSNQLRAIALRARTLVERLQHPNNGAVTPEGEESLQMWKRAYAPQSLETFVRRLSWDELDPAEAASRLSSGGPAKPPAWAKFLGDAMEPARSRPLSAVSRRGSHLPFARLWEPFVHIARQDLQKRAPRIEVLFTGEAREAMEFHLLEAISNVAAGATYELFDANRGDGYDRFIESMFDGGFANFFTEYSALARQICTLAQSWIDSNAEFVQRLDADRDAIANEFGSGTSPGRVSGLQPGLSDRHDGGREVIALTFESGMRVVYKPRDIALTRAYNDFLRWLKVERLPDSPGFLKVVVRHGYGWIEFAEQRAALDAGEVRRYFRKAGSLLAIAHAFRGADLHMENVIAAADGPVIIDVEALFQPEVATATREQGVTERLRSSALSTGLLTFYQRDAEGNVYDMSGLGGHGGHLASGSRCRWTALNTDEMKAEYGPAFAEPMKNVLMCGGEAQRPEGFADEICEGFDAAYRFLMERRDEILSAEGPLRNFRNHRCRLVLRPSSIYGMIIERLITPNYQREGILAGFLIDSLNRVFHGETARPALWPLTRDERQALESLDIPLFTLPAGETEIHAANGEAIRNYVRRSGYEAVEDRIRSFTTADRDSQLELIASALLPRAHVSSANVAGKHHEVAPLSESEWIRRARAIGDRIVERIIGVDSNPVWITPGTVQPGDQSDNLFNAHYLYEGTAGVAVFLAALARTGEGAGRYRGLTKSIFRSVERLLADQNLASEGIGVCNGLGSLVFSAALIAEFLGDDEYARIGLLAADAITAEKISSDQRLDVEGGAAGAILGLLALQAVTGEGRLLRIARACGDHLVATARRHSGNAARMNQDGAMLAGFAHGAAGIGLALARLGAATGDTTFNDIAHEAFRYERSIFDRHEENWPILNREGAPSGFMNAWCHGAPGIALSRIGAGENGDDLEQAIRTTLREGPSPVDHLCCGNLGRIETLLLAGPVLGDREIVATAQRRAAGLAASADATGSYRLSISRKARAADPGFFRGEAGIGYQFLRLARPSEFPSILMFEVPR